MAYKQPSNDDIPLPPGWQMCRDVDGKIFFVDHHNQETSWIDPRDRYVRRTCHCVGIQTNLVAAGYCH